MAERFHLSTGDWESCQDKDEGVKGLPKAPEDKTRSNGWKRVELLSHPGHGCPKGAFSKGNWPLFFLEDLLILIQEASSVLAEASSVLTLVKAEESSWVRSETSSGKNICLWKKQRPLGLIYSEMFVGATHNLLQRYEIVLQETETENFQHHLQSQGWSRVFEIYGQSEESRCRDGVYAQHTAMHPHQSHESMPFESITLAPVRQAKMLPYLMSSSIFLSPSLST